MLVEHNNIYIYIFLQIVLKLQNVDFEFCRKMSYM
jgi:hypothetical protein